MLFVVAVADVTHVAVSAVARLQFTRTRELEHLYCYYCGLR